MAVQLAGCLLSLEIIFILKSFLQWAALLSCHFHPQTLFTNFSHEILYPLANKLPLNANGWLCSYNQLCACIIEML